MAQWRADRVELSGAAAVGVQLLVEVGSLVEEVVKVRVKVG